MKETFAKAEELAEHLKEYINNRMDEVKLNTAEKTSGLAAAVIAGAVVFFFFMSFIFFASIALAFVFTKITGELYWGFLITGGIYLIMALLIWIFRVQLLQLPLMNALLNQFYTEDEEDE